MATVTSSKRHLVLTSDTYTSNGDVVVGGDLTIQGTTTTLDTANLLVEDKNIIIGNVSSPSDTTADGGGITLKGATDKTISWSNSNNRWDFNQGITSSGDITAANISGSTSGANTGDQDLSGYSTTSHNHDGRYLRTHARYQDDLDTITTSGVYIWDVSEADDEPTGAADGLLTIKYWDSAFWATASFQDFHNRTLHIKSKKNGTWQTDWAQVWTTDQLTTTNKTNYDTAYTHSQATHAPTDAEANVQANWTATSGDALILNKPTIPPDYGAHNGVYLKTNYRANWIRVGYGNTGGVRYHKLATIVVPSSYVDYNATFDWTGRYASGTAGIHVHSDGNTTAVVYGAWYEDFNPTKTLEDTNGWIKYTISSDTVEIWIKTSGWREFDYVTKDSVTEGSPTITWYDENTTTDQATEPSNLNAFTNRTHTAAGYSTATGVADNAEVNVQADWTATSGDSLILNKPTIPTVPSSYAPTDAEANVQVDWTETTTTSDAFILNKPTTFAPTAHTHDVIIHNSTNSIDVHDHSNHTWFRNSTGSWTFQTGADGDNWTQTYMMHLPAAGSTANAVMMELGQRNSNEANGRYKGVRIVKYATSAVADGDLTAANISATSSLAVTGTITSQSTTVVGTTTISSAISSPGDLLHLNNQSNGALATIKFTDQATSISQYGRISFGHSDSASYGSGAHFSLGSTESATTILADGKLMYAEGIYSKPSSGTGAGTRRDTNWNTAYTHSQATHAPTNAEANVQADWNATSGDALILNKPSIPAVSGKGQNINYIQSNLPSSDTTYRDNFGAGVWAYSGYSTGSDRPTTYDATLQVMPTADLGFEISTGWHGTGEGKIQIRALRDCCEGWGSYYDVWTSANFTPSSFISATSADTASELITFSKGISSDGNAKFYNWRALDNTSGGTDYYHRIARITGTQSTRFVIEIAGRQSSYSDNSFPAFGKIVGQLNNDHNYDITFYNFTIGTTVEAVLEVGQLDVDNTQTDIYIRHGQFAELTATAHISDGSITTYSNDSGSAGAPSGYVQSSEVEVWNSSNDGSGSGMDADYVDGLHASSFIRSDADDTASGTYTFTGSAKFALDSTFANSEVRLPATTGQNPTMMFYRPTGAAATSYPWRFQAGGGGSSSSFYIGTGSSANNGSETIANKLSISSTGTLSVSGDVIAYGAPSDAKYKENVKPIENALGKVMDLEGVSFDWKENSDVLDIKEDIGFIAQDVQKVVPELVRENEDGKLSLRYQGITPILLEAIKELKAEIEELKKQIK